MAVTLLNRVRVAITSGSVVGNAFMNFYFTTAAAANLTAINTLLTAIKANLVSGQTFTIPGGGDVISDNDGKLQGSWSAAAPAPVVGSGAGSFAGNAGGMCKWIATAVVDSHRPVGRLILVPLVGSSFGADGRLSSTFQNTLQTAANAFLANTSGFSIWHRPVYTGKPPNRVLVRDGATVPVSSALVQPVAATLRSRNH